MKKSILIVLSILFLTASCVERKPSRLDKTIFVLATKADKKWNKWLEKENADSVWNSTMK